MSQTTDPELKPSLLLLEDDRPFCETLVLEFEERGYLVSAFHRVDEALDAIQTQNFRFALIDLRLKGDSGLQFIQDLKALQPECRSVVLTGYGSIATAVEAIKRGAVNYLTKPAPIERIEKALWMEVDDEASEIEESYTSLDRHEQEYLEYVLLQCQGNISQAARWLGIHRQSLQRKLKRTGLR